MENFSINFLIKETKKLLAGNEIFINKIKLKKKFLILQTPKTNIFFPLTPKSPPFFVSSRKIKGEDASVQDINVYRKYFENSKLVDIKKPFYERVVFFEFSKMMIWGESKNFTFAINCASLPHRWYILENNKIIFSKYDNEAVAGTEFTLPEDDRLPFEQMDIEKIDKMSEREITARFKGFSTVYAKELKARKNKKLFLDFLKQSQPQGGFKYQKDCYPFPLEHTKETPVVFNLFTECVENRFFEKLYGEETGQLKTKLLKKTKKEIQSKEKLLKKLEKELNQCEKGNELLKTAEILSSNFNKLKKGLNRVRVFDFYLNKEREIHIDPSLSPSENISKLYKKASKLIKKKPIVKERIKTVKAEIAALNDKLYLIENANSFEELREFDDKKERKEKKIKGERAGIERIELEKGFFVYVGKNSKANQILYSQKLSKNDLWFHAKDIPGSHVILKNPLNLKTKDIPPSVIEKAAQIAAYYSKGRNDTLVEVQYTTKDNLYSSKGKGAGFVLLREFETILVKPDKPGEKQKNS